MLAASIQIFGEVDMTHYLRLLDSRHSIPNTIASNAYPHTLLLARFFPLFGQAIQCVVFCCPDQSW